MQFGALGAVPAVAGGAWLAGDRRLAARLLAEGTATWALSKLVKRNVQRPGPAMLLAGAPRPPARRARLPIRPRRRRHRARRRTLPRLSPAGRAAALGIVSAVALSRVYVGAHLPLDIAGGIALGITVDAAVALTAWQADSRRDEQ